jgi:asparagine synthetase B (glutamine-hydrolysing)
MFGGYLARKRNETIEYVFSKYSLNKLHDFVFQSNGHIGWVFHDYKQQFDRTYSDCKEVLIADGIPIVGSSSESYCSLHLSSIGNKQHKFDYCLNQVVSNVNLLGLVQNKECLSLNLASNNTSCGRIYYTRTKDGTIIFCNDFRPLIAFSDFQVDYQAYIAIIKYAVPPDPLTIIEGIKCVPANHVLEIDTFPYTEKIRPFFQFRYSLSSSDLSTTNEALKRSLQVLSTFDPVLLLSGGVDSTLLAQYLSLTKNNKVKAYFLAFGDDDQEEEYAQYASEKTNIQLKTCRMGSEHVITTINEMIPHYIHPFLDDSALPTFYLVNLIAKSLAEKKVLIDGLGADGCFSEVNEGSRLALNIGKAMFRQPRALRQFTARLFQSTSLSYSSKNGKFSQLCSLMARTGEPNLNQAMITYFPYDNFFNEDCGKVITKLRHYFEVFFNSFTASDSLNSFKTRSTTIDLVHLVRSFAMKTYGIYPSKIESVYPFLWRDILTEQGKLGIKKYHGINKYPPKKLLERTMPKEFVHRKKSFFAPPILEWLREPQISKFAYATIVEKGCYIKNIISTHRLQWAFQQLLKPNSYSSRIMAKMIWAVLFTELWLKLNRDKFRKTRLVK